MPVRMYNWNMLQNAINHFARGHICISQVVRGGWIILRDGVNVPILVLKSPHTKVSSCGWRCSNTFSSWEVAWPSVMLRLVKEELGGRYTLAMFTRWLFGRRILVWRQNSFPDVDSTYMELHTYIARPPLVPIGRRYSKSLYPLSWGGSEYSAIHVSCRHKTSKSSWSMSSNSFR